jgi:hypothetical protein
MACSDQLQSESLNHAAWFTFEFTGEQWDKLVSVWGKMPDDARAEFEKCTRKYLWERRSDPTVAKKLRERQNRLRKKIISVLEDPEWKFTVYSLDGALDIIANLGRPPSFLFGTTLDSLLNLLADRLARQNWGLPDASGPGPKSSQASYRFIADVAAVLEKHTQQPATRSNNRGRDRFKTFIAQLCAVADPEIGRGTIDEALKEYINTTRNKAPW